jgi:2-dehydro-3-deoxygluconokinase
MGKKIVTFGEIMMRLTPFDHERIVQANQFQVRYGGGEANVAVSLAYYGHEVSFVTRLPENPIGNAALNNLKSWAVDTNFIIRGGDRLGIYFLEHGASIRPSKVNYDRSNSAISEINPEDLDWDLIFEGKDWFHITGITPALSKSCAIASLEAVKAAKKKGLQVSCDLNYRKKLWSKDEARKVMNDIVKFVDVIIANEEDASDVFGIKSEDSDVLKADLSVEGYKSVSKQLRDLCNSDLVAITLRESLSASDNNWSAIIFNGKEYFTSKKYPIHLVDRVGGGDAFGAGLIHGIIKNWDLQKVLEFGVAASALKQTIPGDMNLVSEGEVLAIMEGDISGRVQR